MRRCIFNFYWWIDKGERQGTGSASYFQTEEDANRHFRRLLEVLIVFVLQEPCDSVVALPWPAVYILHSFPPELQAAVQKEDPGFKKKDKSHIRALLIQVLFDSINKHTWYPTHKMYGDVLGDHSLSISQG
ncbi:hypothetical protein QQF64_034607 [Cirrhinus molitorella]|uniref:Uncharacterized protein n=1 Tax=Cirrhinus molitorella TaxID=172907 RepID=A0ABR3L1A0_9TELE